MKSRMMRRCCVALAAAALLVPTAASAQEHRGSRTFGGSGRHDGGRDHGGRSYGGHNYGHASHGHHGSSSFSFWVGPGWGSWWGPWGYVDPYPYYRPYAYPYPYYSNPYQYYVPPAASPPPPVYEQPAPAPQQGESVWYYCPDPPGYYPYVRQCPKGWTKVAPSPESDEPPAAGPEASDQGDPLPYEYRWYYCQDPPGYYPYVQDCPGGWTTVAPTPAPAR